MSVPYEAVPRTGPPIFNDTPRAFKGFRPQRLTLTSVAPTLVGSPSIAAPRLQYI